MISMLSHELVETTPAHMDENGDFVPAMEHRMYGPENQYARSAGNQKALFEDHSYFAGEVSVSQEEPAAEAAADTDGPVLAINLAERGRLFLNALDKTARAKVTQGMANNFYNRGAIARRANMTAGEVNDYGAAMAPERRKTAEEAFYKLMGYDSMRAAGMDLTGMPTFNDFVKEFYSDTDPKAAESRRRAARRRMKKWAE